MCVRLFVSCFFVLSFCCSRAVPQKKSCKQHQRRNMQSKRKAKRNKKRKRGKRESVEEKLCVGNIYLVEEYIRNIRTTLNTYITPAQV